jgi:hypothetical protein
MAIALTPQMKDEFARIMASDLKRWHESEMMRALLAGDAELEKTQVRWTERAPYPYGRDVDPPEMKEQTETFQINGGPMNVLVTRDFWNDSTKIEIDLSDSKQLNPLLAAIASVNSQFAEQLTKLGWKADDLDVCKAEPEVQKPETYELDL